MEDKKATAGAGAGGIGFCGLLTIAFIVLKLLHVIDWSWFWVLSPLIFSTGLAIVFILVSILIILILGFIANR